MKIALIQTPVFGTYDPPLGLAQLSSCLKQEGHEVFVFDLNIEFYLKRKETYKFAWAWEQCVLWAKEDTVNKFFDDNREMIAEYVNKIVNTGAGLICFSVTNVSILPSLKIAQLIKEKNRNVITVFGGALFFERHCIEETINNECVDVVAFGEGELTLCDIAEKIEKGKSFKNCLGISVKDRGRTCINGPRPYVKDLDTLPYLDFSGLPLTNYDDPNHLPFMASRGCIFKCAFCSSREFWKGYRVMSGKRMFDEIYHHYLEHDKKIRHVDFLDLLINGKMKSLVDFCDLLIEAKLVLNWSANAIIRPEMTTEVLQKLKNARCQHLIYGIESGSERVLRLMKKNYKIKDADMVLKATHDAGIMTTANFMFGFPGETEEDFDLTLEFIRRNAKSLHRVYPSRTFCALEQHSYLFNNYEEFNVKAGFPSHLYWESLDGSNTYPVRQQRCERFSKIADRLGIEVGCGVQSSLDLDHWLNLAEYYEIKEDLRNTTECYLNYFDLDDKNKRVREKILNCFRLIDKRRLYSKLGLSLIERLRTTAKRIEMLDSGVIKDGGLKKLGRPQSLAYLKSACQQNLSVNDREYKDKEIALYSFPRTIIIQASGPCTPNCTCCSDNSGSTLFDIADFRRRFEEKMHLPFLNARSIIFAGSGEFLSLPDASEALDYFDVNFPHVEKTFSMGGAYLFSWVCDKALNLQSSYTFNISLSASNNNLHKIITGREDFYKILGQVKYLLKMKKDLNKKIPMVNLVFFINTLNMEDLSNFIGLADNLGVDNIICRYSYIRDGSKKDLSCFFKQELTNSILAEAKELADRLGLGMDLPPKFKQGVYPEVPMCREPFSRFMLDVEGHVLPCSSADDCKGHLAEVAEFKDMWNGSYYQGLRRSTIEGSISCYDN
ncbi:MAG: radical SAM protein, partial [Candidatus Omnitrophica bacterium]|nr:radical SAM protein [Candidatus Omnitrophota bacterium]